MIKPVGVVVHRRPEGDKAIPIAGPMPSPCVDCPFTSPVMAAALAPDRLDGIKAHVKAGGFFPCHKTIDYSKEVIDDNGNHTGECYDLEEMLSRRECAGAIQWRDGLAKKDQPG